ncbi:MAG: peptide-methionine (S)-S-oxide reductase MsrA [Firmicutes bacterium]|jgi:peptide-methionine (S)-S-oxide reductase|nr:peptide-methionine (S)-S-oxide reductase MsrA [Bacillota bacterium]
MFSFDHNLSMVEAHNALPGNKTPVIVSGTHYVLGTPLTPPFPPDYEKAVVAMGCFWGAERAMWSLEGVYTTAAGYCGGFSQNPTYEQVCSGKTGHAESVLVIFDPTLLSYAEIIKVFYETHDPTQYMKQGNDVGTQYRSAIYCDDPNQMQTALEITQRYQNTLITANMGQITTEISLQSDFYYAEEYHQQYLAKNPSGYCGLKSTGLKCL